MSPSGLKLTYNGVQLRARLEATAADFRGLSALPADIKLRAQNKLKAEQQAGNIVDVASSFNILEQFITKISTPNYQHIPDDHHLVVTLALGIPPLVEQFKVQRYSSGGLYLSIEEPIDKIQALSYYSFAVCLRHVLKPLGFIIDHAQIAALYWRTMQGETINKEALLSWSRPPKTERSDGAAYTCYFNDDLQGLVLRVFDMQPLLTESGRQTLIQWLATQASKYDELAFGDHFLMERLAATASGIESVGLNLPFDILAGLRRRAPETLSAYSGGRPPLISPQAQRGPHKVLADHQPVATTPALPPAPPPARYPGANLLQVEVAPDAMTARIVGFNLTFYDIAPLDEAWLKKELDRLKILVLSPESLKRAGELLKQRGDLTGIQIASGSFGRAGSKPYIAQIKRAADPESEQVNHRKIRPSLMAKAGEHIASIAYEVDEEPGHDVHGRVLMPPAPETNEFTVGPGIELREGRYFHAQYDGVLQIQKQAIELSRTLVHVGDVNLASGDIDFDGPVLVQGSIDTGASVRSSGDLTVQGSIRGGHVYCGGNLEVKAGINSSSRGFIFCRGSLHTEFIESSVVVCLGNLRAEKAILNSSLFVEGNVLVASQRAVLAGGDLYVWGEVSTSNVGLPSGIATNIHLGCNWRWARQVENNKRRLQYFEALSERTQKEWQELKSKPQSQMSSNKKDALNIYQTKLEKLQKITTRCQANLQRFKKDRPFNQKSRALIRGKVQPRSHFYAESKILKVAENLQSIAVLAFTSSGDTVRPLDQVPTE